LLNVVPGGKTPLFDLREAQAMGYRLPSSRASS